MLSAAIAFFIIGLLYLIISFRPILRLWVKKRDIEKDSFYKNEINKEIIKEIKHILIFFLLFFALLPVVYHSYQLFLHPSPDPDITREIGQIKNNLHEINEKLVSISLPQYSSDTAHLTKSMDVLQSDHQVIKNRLNNLEETTHNYPSSESMTFVKWVSLVLIGIGIVGFGIYFLGTKSKWDAIISIASLLGGVALLGIETFNGEFRFFERSIFNHTDTDRTEGLNYNQMALDSIGAITGFKEGTSDKEYDTVQFKGIAENFINIFIPLLMTKDRIRRRIGKLLSTHFQTK